MKWSNLKNGSCPKCGEILKEKGIMLQCLPPCEFRIRSEKALDIIRNKPRERSYGDNQADLANIPNPRRQ